MTNDDFLNYIDKKIERYVCGYSEYQHEFISNQSKDFSDFKKDVMFNEHLKSMTIFCYNNHHSYVAKFKNNMYKIYTYYASLDTSIKSKNLKKIETCFSNLLNYMSTIKQEVFILSDEKKSKMSDDVKKIFLKYAKNFKSPYLRLNNVLCLMSDSDIVSSSNFNILIPFCRNTNEDFKIGLKNPVPDGRRNGSPNNVTRNIYYTCPYIHCFTYSTGLKFQIRKRPRIRSMFSSVNYSKNNIQNNIDINALTFGENGMIEFIKYMDSKKFEITKEMNELFDIYKKERKMKDRDFSKNLKKVKTEDDVSYFIRMFSKFSCDKFQMGSKDYIHFVDYEDPTKTASYSLSGI